MNNIYNEVIGYLESINDIKFKIEVLRNQIEETKDRLTSLKSITNYEEVKVKNSYISNDEIPNSLIRLDELVEEKERLLNKYIFFKNQIIKEIFELQILNEQKVLYYTYVKNMKQEDIASMMNYSSRHIGRILQSAIESFAKRYYEVGYVLEW